MQMKLQTASVLWNQYLILNCIQLKAYFFYIFLLHESPKNFTNMVSRGFIYNMFYTNSKNVVFV